MARVLPAEVGATALETALAVLEDIAAGIAASTDPSLAFIPLFTMSLTALFNESALDDNSCSCK